MKKIVCLFIFLFCYSAYSQSLSVFNINASNFPKIKANFFAFDNAEKQITNLSTSDFSITENGQPRTINNASCPEPLPPLAISSVLVFDMSISMDSGPPRIQSAKDAANAWIDGLPAGQFECALVSFAAQSYLVNDFTTDKQLLKNKISQFVTLSGTDYDQALLVLPSGGLQIAKNGKYKRVVILLTDGEPNNEPKTNEIIQFALENKITIYAVTLDMPAPKCIKDITEQTGGAYFENITTLKEAEDTYRRLLEMAQGGEPCEIEWQSQFVCKPTSNNVEIKIPSLNSFDNTTYTVPDNKITYLEVSSPFVIFEDVKVGIPKDTIITVTARNTDYNITNIKSNNSIYDINPKSFTLAENQSKQITITFTPTDSVYSNCTFEFETEQCNKSYNAYSIYNNSRITNSTLKITHPNGGEKFVAGSDTLITWEGVSPSDSVKLEYSIDEGENWIKLVDFATGLKYVWRDIPLPVSNKCIMRISKSTIKNKSTLPRIEWQKSIGCSWMDYGNSIVQTIDGGYIVAGSVFSRDSCDIGKTKGWWDYGIMKLDKVGNIEWQKKYGGNADDYANCIQQTNDGGYIVAGWVNSEDGDVTKRYFREDCWIVKLEANGSIEWEKSLGGFENDRANSIIQTLDGGYIVAGASESTDQDAIGNHGDFDYLVVKLSALGDKEWIKLYGGSGNDEAKSIIQTSEGGYLIAGQSQSNDGDVLDSKGKRFVWLVKTNPLGNIEWSKSYGDMDYYNDVSVLQSYDNGFVMGYNNSKKSSVLVKLTQNGDEVWELNKGNYNQIIRSISLTKDGGYIIAGSSTIDIDETILNYGYGDYWIMKVSPSGFVVWTSSIGGTQRDECYSIKSTYDSGYILAGTTSSDNFDVKENHGGSDIWVVKLSPDRFSIQEDQTDSVFEIVAPTLTSYEIDMKKCYTNSVKDSVIGFFIKNTGLYKCRIDSIYFKRDDVRAFKLITSFHKSVLDAGEVIGGEIRFKPNHIGNHYDEMIVITQYDTLHNVIKGEGVSQQVGVVNKIIDFGKMYLGEIKDTLSVLTIKNMGKIPVTITSTKHNLPNDKDFTTIAGGGNFTLKSFENHKMDLKFKPSDFGRTMGTLEFYFNGLGSPEKIMLYGECIKRPPQINATINQINDLVCETQNRTDLKITNIGEEDLVISKIDIVGKDRSEFSAIVTLPITVLMGETITIPIEFTSYTAGTKDAELVINSNAGKTPEIRIALLAKKFLNGSKIDNSQIDLQGIYINTTKKAIISIENNGNLTSVIKLTSSPKIQLNITDFTLQPNELKEIEFTYLGSSTLGPFGEEVTVEETSCNYISKISIYGTIVDGAYGMIKIPAVEGQVNETINIPIIVTSAQYLQAAGVKTISAEMSFNSTMLYPVGLQAQKIDATTSSIFIDNIPIEQNAKKEVPFIVALGNAEMSDLKLFNVQAVGGPGTITSENGTFKTLGICREGGTRLFNPTGKVEILQIIPNPASEDIEINVNLIEDGTTTLSVFNSNGLKIKEFNITGETGMQTIKLDGRYYSNGLYFIQLQTPTVEANQKLMIIK
ncbi:MAG: choice-of-anchor D domain-containing protein [bacterium]